MTEKTISITRALVELKRLNDRISTAISSGKFVSRTIGKNSFQKVVGSNESVEQTKSKIQASFDSVEALINERQKIKSQIVLSNANTKVKVLGKEITVAEAIELKGTVQFRTQYLNTLRIQLLSENKEVEKANVGLEVLIDSLMNTIYGADKSKIDATILANVANPQRDQKEVALLDPQGISARIKQVEEDISNLSSELDFTLSESNAKTTITV